MELLPCPAYFKDMLPIVSERHFVGRRLIRDPRPATLKEELWLGV